MFLKPKSSGIVVGLTFAEDAVRLVAARQLPSGDVQVEQALSVTLPSDALVERGIANVEQVTEVVRGALSQITGPIRSVVIGLPSRATIAHGLSVPTVSAKEQRAIVRSEIDALNLLPPGQEAFDFLVFPQREDTPTPKDGTPKADSAFFFAAEQYIVEQFRSVVTGAGAHVAGIEPSEYAATRVAQGQVMNSPLALAVSIGSHHTYLQFFADGLPVYARRLDVGADQILPESSREAEQTTSSPSGEPLAPLTSYGEIDSTPIPSPYDLDTAPTSADAAPGGSDSVVSPWQLSGLMMPGTQPSPTDAYEESQSDQDLPPGFPSANTQLFGNSPRERMLSEISRSLDYFGRQYQADTADIPIVLLPNHAGLDYLPARAASVLEQAVHSAAVEDAALLSPSLGPLAASGADYAVALGLTLGQMGAQWSTIPLLDLGRDAADAARARKVPRLLVGAGAAGVVLLATGIAVAFALEQQALPIRMELENTQHSLQSLNLEEQRARSDSMQQMDLVRQIRMQNMPWTNVLRNIARAVPSGVGLTRVIVQGGTLGITGDTTSPNRVVQFWSRMNTSPFFAGATVTSIQRNDDKITFQMNVVLPSEPQSEPQEVALGSTPAKSG